MEALNVILAVVLLVAYAAKRVVQKLSKVETKAWYLETETWGMILAEVCLTLEGLKALFGGGS